MGMIEVKGVEGAGGDEAELKSRRRLTGLNGLETGA